MKVTLGLSKPSTAGLRSVQVVKKKPLVRHFTYKEWLNIYPSSLLSRPGYARSFYYPGYLLKYKIVYGIVHVTFEPEKLAEDNVENEASQVAPKPPKPSSVMMPWDAIGFALNYVFTSSTRDESRLLAKGLRYYDMVGRSIVMGLGIISVGVLVGVSELSSCRIDFGKDWFALLALVTHWFAQAVLLAGQIYGRLRSTAVTVLEEDKLTNTAYYLPNLIFNYEPFGFERPRSAGYIRCMIVLLLYVSTTWAWAVLLYTCAARMISYDFYRWQFGFIMMIYLSQQLVTACALSVRYQSMRPSESKPGSPLTNLEQSRYTLNNVYIFVVFVLVLPIGGSFVVYGLS